LAVAVDLCCLYPARGYAVAGARLSKPGQPTSVVGQSRHYGRVPISSGLPL